MIFFPPFVTILPRVRRLNRQNLHRRSCGNHFSLKLRRFEQNLKFVSVSKSLAKLMKIFRNRTLGGGGEGGTREQWLDAGWTIDFQRTYKINIALLHFLLGCSGNICKIV